MDKRVINRTDCLITSHNRGYLDSCPQLFVHISSRMISGMLGKLGDDLFKK